MRISEIILENKSRNIICVDVQPEYSGIMDGCEQQIFADIIEFVVGSTGKVLMFINAEQEL